MIKKPHAKHQINPLPKQQPPSFDELSEFDPFELWAEYSPIARQQQADDYGVAYE
jgi:hypothetical protein